MPLNLWLDMRDLEYACSHGCSRCTVGIAGHHAASMVKELAGRGNIRRLLFSPMRVIDEEWSINMHNPLMATLALCKSESAASDAAQALRDEGMAALVLNPDNISGFVQLVIHDPAVPRWPRA